MKLVLVLIVSMISFYRVDKIIPHDEMSIRHLHGEVNGFKGNIEHCYDCEICPRCKGVLLFPFLESNKYCNFWMCTYCLHSGTMGDNELDDQLWIPVSEYRLRRL